MTALPFAPARGGARLRIRLAPKSASERIAGLVADEDGAALKIAVRAPPEDGQANEALLRLLAGLLALPRGDLSLARGAAARRKLVHLAGEPAALCAKLREVLAPWLAQR